MGITDLGVFSALWVGIFICMHLMRASGKVRLSLVKTVIAAAALAAMITVSSFIKYSWNP